MIANALRSSLLHFWQLLSLCWSIKIYSELLLPFSEVVSTVISQEYTLYCNKSPEKQNHFSKLTASVYKHYLVMTSSDRNLQLTRYRKFPCSAISFFVLDPMSWPSSWHFYVSKYSSTRESLLPWLILLIRIRLLMWMKLCVNIGLCSPRISSSKPYPPSLSPWPMNSSGFHSHTNKQAREPRDINWPGARARMSFFQSKVLRSGFLVPFLIMVLHSVKFLPGLPKHQLPFKASIWSYDRCKIAGLFVMKCLVMHSHEKCLWILVKNDIQSLNFVLNQLVCRYRKAGFIMLKKKILWNILKSRCKGFFFFFFFFWLFFYYQVCQNTSKVMELIK